MTIDAHLHCKLQDCEAMCAHLDALGIDRALLMGLGENDDEGNFRMRDEHPERFMVAVSPRDTERADLFRYLEESRKRGAISVGEFIVNRPFDDPYVETVLELAEDLGMCLTFHMSPSVGCGYGVVDHKGLPLLEKALGKFPSLTFIAHSQPFWIEISDAVPDDDIGRNAWGSGPIERRGRVFALMERYPNLCCDLSANSAGCALMRDEAVGLDFIHRFHDRLLFGTDMTKPGDLFPLKAWLEARLAEGKIASAELEAIMGGNFRRIFSI